MNSLLTKQCAIASQVTEVLKTWIHEWNIGVGYNQIRLEECFMYCMDAFVKLIGWL